MRKLADTAIWIYTTGAIGSLALACYVLLQGASSPLIDLTAFGAFDTSDLTILLMALTLMFSLVFTLPCCVNHGQPRRA